jgi:hypothetical protein
VNDDTLVLRAPNSLPATENAVNPSSGREPRRRNQGLPLGDRLLLDLRAAAALLSVSERSAKRLASDHPELVVHLGRRRLFSRKLLEKWVADGCPEPRARKR